MNFAHGSSPYIPQGNVTNKPEFHPGRILFYDVPITVDAATSAAAAAASSSSVNVHWPGILINNWRTFPHNDFPGVASALARADKSVTTPELVYLFGNPPTPNGQKIVLYDARNVLVNPCFNTTWSFALVEGYLEAFQEMKDIAPPPPLQPQQHDPTNHQQPSSVSSSSSLLEEDSESEGAVVVSPQSQQKNKRSKRPQSKTGRQDGHRRQPKKKSRQCNSVNSSKEKESTSQHRPTVAAAVVATQAARAPHCSSTHGSSSRRRERVQLPKAGAKIRSRNLIAVDFEKIDDFETRVTKVVNSFKAKDSGTGYDYHGDETYLDDYYSFEKIEKIPTFDGVVRNTLVFAGHKFENGKWSLPYNGGYKHFGSLREYRTYMANNGIPIRKGINARKVSKDKRFLKVFVWVVYHRVDNLVLEYQNNNPNRSLTDVEGDIDDVLSRLKENGVNVESDNIAELYHSGIPPEWISSGLLGFKKHVLLELFISCALRQFKSVDPDSLQFRSE